MSFGVPQGSVLGPVLFLLYINDLNMCLDGTGVATTMYADDTSFLLSSKDDRSLEARCGEVLRAAAAWFGQNSLYLNEEKTTYIRFHPHQKRLNTNFQLSTGSGDIKPTDTVKFPGIWVDKNLNFKNHCQQLISRLSSACYLFRNLRGVLTLPQMLALYHAQIHSRLRYCVAFWGLSTLSGNVFISQKRVVRCMAGVSDNTISCRGLFKQFGILTLTGVLILELAVRIFQSRGILHIGGEFHTYDTRNRSQLRTPFHSLTLSQRSPEYMGIKIYNKLPICIKSRTTLHTFKTYLKSYLIEGCFYSLEEFFEYNY